MISRLLVLILVGNFTSRGSGQGQDTAGLEELIDAIFSEAPPLPGGGAQCEAISGSLPAGGCYECFSCDSPDVAGRADLHRLALQRERCARQVEVCCAPAGVALAARGGGACGRGGVALPRDHPAQLAPQEHPWAASVHAETAGGAQYLCEAVLVGAGALLTSARCASAHAAARLRVRMHGHDAALRLQHVAPHPQYSSAGVNDVALLILDEESRAALPALAEPVCLPDARAPPDTPCLSVTRNHTVVHSRVAARPACAALLRQADLALHDSQMCALLDLPTELPHAAPLLCQVAGSSEWTAYGLASYRGALAEYVLHADLALLSARLRAVLLEWDAL